VPGIAPFLSSRLTFARNAEIASVYAPETELAPHNPGFFTFTPYLALPKQDSIAVRLVEFIAQRVKWFSVPAVSFSGTSSRKCV